VKEHRIPWPQVFEGRYWGSSVARLYGITALPFTVLIGRDGRIISVGTENLQLERVIREALAKADGPDR